MTEREREREIDTKGESERDSEKTRRSNDVLSALLKRDLSTVAMRQAPLA